MTVKILTGWNFLIHSVHFTALSSTQVRSRKLSALYSVVILSDD